MIFSANFFTGGKMSSSNVAKKQAAMEAIKYIKDCSVIGVGTGSTVNYFIKELGKIKSRFFLNIDLIINIIYLAFVTSYKHLVQEQLFLMKEFNFTYETFSKLTPHEIKHYVKTGVKLLNERNNSET